MWNQFVSLCWHLAPFVCCALLASFVSRRWGTSPQPLLEPWRKQPAAPLSAFCPVNGRALGKISAVLFVLALVAGVDGQAVDQLRPKPKKSPSWVNGLVHDGVPIKVDLPESEQMRNIGGLDGAGMCVFTSIEMAARYQNLEQMRGFRDWAARNYDGGGWPDKVDELLAAWYTAKKIDPPIPYLQYQGLRPEEVLDVVNRTNRMACITYGYSPRYGTNYIAHMVNCVLFHPQFGVVLDNNFPGDSKMEWMSREELIRRTRLRRVGPRLINGPAWVFVWLTPGSPPPPKGRAPSPGEAR